MYPDDRVLVGVLNRKRDLDRTIRESWYRIPLGKMPNGIEAEYLAFFLSRSASGNQDAGIYYFARISGLELRHRYELLPDEPHHPRAGSVYYRVAFKHLMEKQPPILNPQNRVISFIYTTWDRFIDATTISDLYSQADQYVDRLSNRLQSNGIRAERLWEAEKKVNPHAPGLRIRCNEGDYYYSPPDPAETELPPQGEDPILAEIRRKIEALGGLVPINISPE